MNKQLLLISIIEAVYIYYMFNYFKTTFSIHHPLEYLMENSAYLKHPIYTGEFENKICDFGKNASILIGCWLIVRNFIDYDKIKEINNILINIILIGTFMNMNALLYYLPIFILEKYYLF